MGLRTTEIVFYLVQIVEVEKYITDITCRPVCQSENDIFFWQLV